MRNLTIIALIALAIPSIAEARGYRVRYAGSHHTVSHGGHYRGSYGGSSHRGGHYVNFRTGNHYGRHR